MRMIPNEVFVVHMGTFHCCLSKWSTVLLLLKGLVQGSVES
jgi:hypothetical protein